MGPSVVHLWVLWHEHEGARAVCRLVRMVLWTGDSIHRAGTDHGHLLSKGAHHVEAHHQTEAGLTLFFVSTS